MFCQMRTIGVGILTNPTMAKWWPNFVHIFQHHGAYGGVSETSMKLIDSNSVMFKHVFQFSPTHGHRFFWAHIIILDNILPNYAKTMDAKFKGFHISSTGNENQ